MTTHSGNRDDAPELLYHVKRTIIDLAQDKSGATQITDVLSTFTDLAAAKAAARSALLSSGYLRDDFEQYHENDGNKEWKHGDGVMVFAKAPAGQEFKVGVDTTHNDFHFKGNSSHEVEDHPHYVLQTTIFYNHDSIGSIQTTEVEGAYPTRKAAREAAKLALLDEDVAADSFAEYEEQDMERGEWPYGDDVLIHAVAESGENFQISVKAQPHSHQQHKPKQHQGQVCERFCKHTENGCQNKNCHSRAASLSQVF